MTWMSENLLRYLHKNVKNLFGQKEFTLWGASTSPIDNKDACIGHILFWGTLNHFFPPFCPLLSACLRLQLSHYKAI